MPTIMRKNAPEDTALGGVCSITVALLCVNGDILNRTDALGRRLMSFSDTKEILKVFIVGLGIDHPYISTLAVMIIAGGSWLSLLSYYQKEHRSPPTQVSVPSPVPPSVPVAIDSPCSNENVTSGGPVSINCKPSEEVHPEKPKHTHHKNP
jgi:hypothetical protein